MRQQSAAGVNPLEPADRLSPLWAALCRGQRQFGAVGQTEIDGRTDCSFFDYSFFDKTARAGII
jgi:hypothetical protein